MTQSQLDKRRFYRHPLSMPIQYQEMPERLPDKSSAVDLSEGGVCFLSTHFLAKGTRVNLTIPVGNQMFKIGGKVAYCNRVSTADRYRTGVAFLDPESAFRAKLAEEMIQITAYRKKMEEVLGHEISEEDAARQWIEKHARNFAYLF